MVLKEELLANLGSPRIKRQKYRPGGDWCNQGENGRKNKNDEIDLWHRLGASKNSGKSRPIIIKFPRYNTRCKILRKKIFSDYETNI